MIDPVRFPRTAALSERAFRDMVDQVRGQGGIFLELAEDVRLATEEEERLMQASHASPQPPRTPDDCRRASELEAEWSEWRQRSRSLAKRLRSLARQDALVLPDESMKDLCAWMEETADTILRGTPRGPPSDAPATRDLPDSSTGGDDDGETVSLGEELREWGEFMQAHADRLLAGNEEALQDFEETLPEARVSTDARGRRSVSFGT